MKAAHRLHEASGSVRVPDRDFNRGSRDFLVYQKLLANPPLAPTPQKAGRGPAAN